MLEEMADAERPIVPQIPTLKVNPEIVSIKIKICCLSVTSVQLSASWNVDMKSDFTTEVLQNLTAETYFFEACG